MKALTFNYTKKDGSESDRLVLVTTFPGDKYAGLDLSQLEPTTAAEFIDEAKRIHQAYVDQLWALQVQYDLKHSYRQFLDSGVSQVNES